MENVVNMMKLLSMVNVYAKENIGLETVYLVVVDGQLSMGLV
jgi:hypothetical protein